jgi:hypothetical protein
MRSSIILSVLLWTVAAKFKTLIPTTGTVNLTA